MEEIHCNIVETIEEACTTLAINAQRKGLHLFCCIHNDIPLELIGDPLRVRQIMINLINNAIKFTHSGDIVVRAELHNSDTFHQGIGVHISVADTGIGIPNTKIETIFQPFTQADGSTTRKFGGTGLGLTISKHLVYMMGGDIMVESEEGKGSIFHLTLFFKPVSHTSDKTTHTQHTSPAPLQGIRILVADPHPMGREVVENMLVCLGADVQTVADGDTLRQQSNINAASGVSVNLLIVDHTLLEHLGNFILSELTSNNNILCIKPFHLSEETLKKDQHFAYIRFINKPLGKRALVKAIEDILNLDTVKNIGLQVTEALPVQDRSLHILVVDDLPNNQLLAQEILVQAGHRVTLAAHGGEALERISSNIFDLVLMDLNMPEMDGFAATERIRNAKPDSGINTRIPIIAVTAMTLQEEEQQCRDARMNGYVKKPYRATELLQAIAPFTKKRPHLKKPSADSTISVVLSTEVDTNARNAFLQWAPERLNNLERSLHQESLPEAMKELQWVAETATRLGAKRIRTQVVRLKGKIEMKDWSGGKNLLKDLIPELNRLRSVLVEGSPDAT